MKKVKNSSEKKTDNLKLNNKNGSRRLARKFIIQGVYQWLVSSTEKDEIEKFLSDQEKFKKSDVIYFRECFRNVIVNAKYLREVFVPFLNDSLDRVSPVEHAVLLLGTYELLFRTELPLQIVLNEAIEVDKMLGSNDGHKMINGVLNNVVCKLRRENERI